MRPDTGNTSHIDPDAVEYVAAAASATLTVTGGPLNFDNQPIDNASTAQALTLTNSGGAGATGIALTFSTTVFSRPAGTAGGTRGATLAAGANCTINVIFTPAALGATTGTLTINANVAVNGSPVSLSGTGVAVVRTANFLPTIWTIAQTRNYPTPILACGGDPTQTFTLTNTGDVTLTGVGTGALGGTAANVANYSVVGSLLGPGSTCGNTVTPLAPGATRSVKVQFKPLTSQPAGAKPAMISVSKAILRTQTSTLNGTAN